MAEQTFTSGQILTAAQMTTLQTNIGLSYITSGTLSGTTNFAGCFPSTYNCFRVVGNNVDVTGAAYLGFRMLVGTTPNTTAAHYSALNGLDSNSANLSFGTNSTVGVIGRQIGVSATGDCGFSFDFMNPNVASTRTVCTGTFTSFYDSVGSSSFTGGVVVDIGTAFDGLQMLTLGGQPYAGGTVTIYGYRKL